MACPLSKKNSLALLLFALLALALGFSLNLWINAQHKITVPVPTTGTPLPKSKNIAEFNLRDGSGKPFTPHSLEGHYSFLFFGYTHCQGICPMTMNLLAQVYAQLAQEKLTLPHVVFITLDPKRDTQQVVGQYAKAFNPRFKGVTGPLITIQQLSKNLGVVSLKTQTDKKNYQIDHSGTLYLMNPTGRLIAVFSPPHEKNALIEDYKTLIKS
jgi:protein SCO1